MNHTDNTVTQVSWLHNCTIIRLIHTGSNYAHTTAATAHPCCQHIGSGSVMELGNAMGVGSMGIPSSKASSGPAETLHFQVFWNTPISWDGMWHILYIWELSASQDRYTNIYTNTVSVYKIPAKIDSWTDPLKVHILPDQSFIQKHSPDLLFCMTKLYSNSWQRPCTFPWKTRTTSLKLGKIQGVWAL